MPFQTFSRPAAGVVVAAGLLAAACGSETAPVIDAAAQADSTSGSTASPDTAAEAEVEGPGVEPSESEEPAADVGNHLFPDLETVNVKDGANLNLASELAGGDTPVLLWFWAPH